MLKIPGMLMIGSAGRNVGKTELACSIIRTFRTNQPIVGLKITTITKRDGTCPRGGKGCGVCSSLNGNYCITEEHGDPPDKDTSRLLAAGAAKVFWLRVMKSHLQEGIDELLDTVGRDVVSVCESNSLRSVVEPGLFLMVTDRDREDYKASADAVRQFADITMLFDGAGFTPDASQIRLVRGRWTWQHDATAIVLAGGKSTRMTEDKSMLPVHGRPMVQHVCEQLEGSFGETIVSTNDPAKYSFLGLRTVPDTEPGLGPLMGIASCLAATASDLNFVIGCDIPEISLSLAHRMIRAADGYDAVVPRVTNRLVEPLFAVYRKHLSHTAYDLLASGRNRIRDLLDGCRTKYFDIPEDSAPKNLNTMEEYKAYHDNV